MSPRSVESLPVDLANKLRDVQIDQPDRLNDAIAAVREKRWSLRQIGQVLNMSHEQVRRKGLEGTASKSPFVAPDMPSKDTKPVGERVLRLQRRIPEKTAAKLKALQGEASKMNGTAAPDSPQAKASEEYTQLLGKLYSADLKYPQKAFEEATGQKWQAIRRRLIRGGFITEPPSMKKNYPRKTAEEQRLAKEAVAAH